MKPPPACLYCGERQAFDEAVKKPAMLTRDLHEHCRRCGKRIVWGVTLAPKAGTTSWSKP